MDFEIIEIPHHLLEELVYMERKHSCCNSKKILKKKQMPIQKNPAFSNLAELAISESHDLYVENEYTKHFIQLKLNSKKNRMPNKWYHHCPL